MTAVISQVVIAGKQLQSSEKNYCLASALREIESRRVDVLTKRQQQAALDRLSVIKAVLDQTLMSLEAELYLVELRRAQLSLLASAGLAVLPDAADTEDGVLMEEMVRHWIHHGLEERFVSLKQDVLAGFDNIHLSEDSIPEVGSCD